MTDVAARAAGLPLYAGLSSAELDEVAAGLAPRRFADGEPLINQGGGADGAYFVLSGDVRVLTKLPGGGETLVAEAGAGSLLGELALIRPAPRGATVRAHGAVEALFADRRYFRAALAQRRPVALKLLRNLLAIPTRRLDHTHRQVADLAAREDVGFRAPLAPLPASAVGFDVRAFLPVLPALAELDPAERDALHDLSTVETVARGAALDGEAGGWLVVRGAVLAALPHARGLHQVHILGPGRFCAVDRAIEPSALALAHLVQEHATLLRFPPAVCRQLLDGADQLAQRWLDALARHQATMLLRADQHLTRLVGLGRLYRQHGRDDSIVV